MADPILSFGVGLQEPMGAGLRTPRSDIYSNLPSLGVQGVRSGLADVEIERQQALDRISGLGAPSAPRLQPPPESAMQAGPDIYYSPGMDRFAVGGVEFGREDYDVALQSPSYLGRPASRPTGGDWQRIDPIEYQGYLQSISQGRGFLGNLGVGFQNLGEGVVGGVGRGLQMLGAEETGAAIAQFADENIGLSPAEQARSAAISQEQGLLGQIGTAAVQSIPTLGLAVLGGVGAAGLALRAGAAAGSFAARSSALGGVATTILPLELQTSWDAAEQGGFDTADPAVRNDILYTALTKTAGQTLAPAFIAGGFSPALRRVVSESAQRTMGSRIARGVGAGALEGSAETFATIADRVMFDPELRAEFNQADWAALAPLIINKYGEEALVALGAGFLLGGPLGALGTPTQTVPAPTDVPPPRRDVDSGQPVDALSGAKLDPQAAPGTQGELFAGADLGSTPAEPLILSPEQRVGRQLELPFPAPAAPVETQLELPLQAPVGTQGDLFGAAPALPNVTLQPAPLALPAPADGGTVIPPAPPLPLTPDMRVDTTLPLTPQMRTPLRVRPGQVEMFTPAEMGVGAAAQGRLTGQQLAGAARVPITAPPAVTQAELEVAGQQRLDLSAQPTAMGEQLAAIRERDRLRRQVEEAQQQAAAAARAEQEAQAAQETEQRTQREDQLLRSRREQQQLEADANILGEELVGGDFNILGTAARAEWDAAVAALDPAVRAEVLTGEPTSLAGNEAQAELARLGATLRNRRSNVLRRQRAEPPTIITPLPPNTYGTAEGQPFKRKAQANAPANRKRVAEQITEETDQRVTPKDLEAIEVPGGWALRVKTPPPPATPPTGGRGTQSLRRGASRAVQEPSPAPRAPRQGPQARQRVGEEDTQGQEAAGARETQAEEVVQRQMALSPELKAALLAELNTDIDGLIDLMTDNPGRVDAAIDRVEARARAPEPTPTPTIQRGDTAPRDMSATEAWNSYVAAFLPVTFDLKNLGQLQARWASEVKAGRGNFDAARAILEDSPTYSVLEARELYTTSADPQVQNDALTVMMEQAFTGDPTGSDSALLGNKTVMRFAQDFLNELNWAAADRQTLLEFATLPSVAEARTAEKPTAKTKALNALLESTGVLSTAESVDADTTSNPASALTEEIAAYNEDPHTPAGWEQRRLRELVRDFVAYARENPAAYGSIVEGNIPLYQYIKGGYVNLRAGRIVPDANAVDPRTQERVSEAPEVVERGGAGTSDMTRFSGGIQRSGRYSRIDYNDISTALDANGKPLAGPMPVGKQKLAIRTFLKRLRNPPRVYDFKDQADLRQRNPDLYRRAAAARPEGDFDAALAAGYSFGDGEVIIFTDRIANEAHLKFVLAHETFGHFGLRGVLPTAEFDSLMEGIYDATPSVQRSVDAAMQANPDLGKAEAVEEYLSDFAADLDTSIVRRIWNAIKGALNKLGVTFGDDSVRYVLDQARRYARSPLQGFPVDLNAIGARVNTVETGAASPGRYKSASDFFKDMQAQDAFARMGLPVPRSFQEGLDAAGGKWGNFNDGWRSFKSTFLSLNGFDSRTNPGLKRLHDVLQEATTISMSVRNTLNETMRPALNRAVLGIGGMNNTEYARANELLHHARIRAIMRLRETPLDSREPLVVFDEAAGTYVRTDEVKRLDDLNRLTIDEARNGFSYTFTNTDAAGNVVSTETVRVPPDPNLTTGSKVWLAYEASRKAYIDTELRLLIAQLSAGTSRESTALKEIGSVVPDGQLNTAERALMRTAIRRYQELYSAGSSTNAEGAVVYVDDSIRTAKEFAKAFNTAVIANEDATTDTEAQARNNAVRQFFDQAVADDVIAQIEAFKRRAVFADDRFVVQNKIIALHTQAMQEGGASEFARNSIASQYAPIVRTGTVETRLVAKDATTGKVVSLDGGYKDGLLYSQFDSRAEALAFAKVVRSAFGTTQYTVKARGADGQMVDTAVVFEPVVDRVLVEAANPLGVNLNEFVAGLNYFDINLTPAKREEVITAMTNQDAAARRRLRAGLNPGDARDAISGIAQHIDGRASTIAKVQVRPLIDELMNLRIRGSNELWSGNGAEVERLRARMERTMADPNASKEAKTVAKREYEEALMMYNNTNPEEGDARKNEALNKAARTLSFLDQNASVNESDFEGSGMISAWRSYTSLVQLGGSLATGILNPISVYTNGVPYLASYNSKTAFGGGFGAGRALTEVQRAFKQVGLPGIKGESIMGGMNTAEFWDGVFASGDLQKKYRVTKREAQMIAREIREGRMIPAQSNALINSSRGRTTRGAMSKAIDIWMSPFNLTEQASRRAFGLASFRLEYARQMQGIDPALDPNSGEFKTAEQAAYDRAVDFAGRAMDTALGDYSVLNRPAFFRSGLPGILYMYKVFPTTSIQMFNNLSMNGKMGMLAALWFLGGVAAFPFAEDLEDLLDTLMQQAGVGEGSVRAWAAQRLDEISPGLSPAVLKGVMGNVLPGDIAGRVALSVIPGTEILLAGANTTRALEEIAGPMPSALLGTAQFAADLVRAPFSTTVTMEKVLREAPVTGLRMAADAYAYTQSGAIIDRRGYVVAEDVTPGEIAARLAGFYPRRAAETYGSVRVIQRIANYRREAATSYRQEWVSARIRNDRDRMREIEQAVRDWNNYHRGSPLAIDNFRESANRAYREATRPAVERGLRAVPQAGRDQLTAIADALTL